MSLRTKVARMVRRDPAEHQTHRLALATVLIPQDVRDAALAPIRTGQSERYQERVNRECQRLFPALDTWALQLERDCVLTVPGGPDDPIPDEVWNAPALRCMPIPSAGGAVLQEARRAIRAHQSGPAADELERDALAACAYAGHLALNLQRSLPDLEADADRAGVWD